VRGSVFIGTSGWHYKHWHSTFYPDDMEKQDFLSYYSHRFPTVEVNATFYRLPTEKVIHDWRDKVFKDFIYSVKGSRLITHYKRLRSIDQELKIFLKRVSALNRHLGPILWQLPPFFTKDLELLENFLEKLPKKMNFAMEFRHPSWIEDDVFKLLRRHNVAQVWLSSEAMPVNCTITADFAYVRFHGLDGGAFHDYTKKELEPWAERLIAAAKKGRDVFVYFNNDLNTRAPENARQLIEMVGSYSVVCESDEAIAVS
jgi:uncharacterized protein YecE (DUF72 family)